MTDLTAPTIILIILTFLILFVLCVIWHHITAMRYRKIKDEKGKQYKWYQLLGKLNEIGFWVKFVAALILGFILFVCLHYLCCTYPHQMDKTPDFDYFGVIAGFFAILVTLLVGWQIYSTIKAKEELKDFTDQFDERLKSVEICCKKGRARMTKIENDAKDLEERLKGIIWSEVYFSIMGYDSLNHESKNDIAAIFSDYSNSISNVLRTIARQVLIAKFSQEASNKEQEKFIDDIVNRVAKSQVEAFDKELSKNKVWIQHVEFSKVSELINKILDAYPKESK